MKYDFSRPLDLSSSSSTPTLRSVKKDSRLIKHSVKLLSERSGFPSLAKTNGCLKDITRQRSNPGKKLLAIGTALLIIPDPITDVAAVPVLIAGKALQSKQSSNVKDVYDEIRQTVKSISSLSSL